jgi:L-threonylcarbamoyladenylate synthase
MAGPVTRVLDASPPSVAQAVACWRNGGLVAFPTETVYGLGADATNANAVARLYDAKGRPAFNPLIAHVPDVAAARWLARFDATAEQLAQAFWPGPLTLVLPKAADCPVCDLATAGLPTLAVRVPAHPLAHALLSEFGGPVAAPSANRSGHISPTTAAHVRADLDGSLDLIVDGGPTGVGLESTIVACGPSGVTLLRAGGITRAALEALLGAPLQTLARAADNLGTDITAPGQLASHYAPACAKLRLNAAQVRPGEGLLAFGPPLAVPHDAGPVENLSPDGDLQEAAARLFGLLRRMEMWPGTIAVMPVPEHGLGEAINDRLSRAAAQV